MANLATISNNILADSGIDSITVVVGSGTVNYVPKFSASGTIGNSSLINSSSGILGLGVSPSAWSGVSSAFELNGNAYIYSTTGVISIGANAYFNGTNWIYKTTQATTRYEQVNGLHQWGTAASGTAGNSISWTNGMTLKATSQLQLNQYGAGTYTGTVAYNLAVDSSGNVIETAGGVVDGSGTANYIPRWQDANTLTNSLIYDNGTNVGINTTSLTSLLTVLSAGGATNGITYGISNTQKEQTLMESRTVGLASGSTTEVCSIDFDDGAGYIEINLVGHVGGDSVSAKYILPVQYGNSMQSNSSWLEALPISSRLTFSGELSIRLDIKVSNSTTTIRLRRPTTRTQNSVYTLSIKVLGNSYTYTSSSTTATGVSAPGNFYYGANMVMNGDGYVGINKNNPQYSLDVTGDARFTSNLTASISALATASNAFVVSDSGMLKYRTAAQVLSDIGAASSSSLSNYLPLTGGSLSGSLTIQGGNSLILQNASTNSNTTIYNSGGSGVSNLNINSKVSISGTGGQSDPLLSLSGSSNDSYNFMQANLSASLSAGKSSIILIGKSLNALNSGYIGFNWNSAGGTDNYLTFGLYDVNHAMRLYGNGNVAIASGDSGYKLNVGGTGYFSGDLSVITAGSTAILFDGTNPTITLRRNNNGNASSAINFKGSTAVKWQIGTNQATGLGFEINEGDATSNRFYIAPGGAATFSSSVTAGGDITANGGSATAIIVYNSSSIRGKLSMTGNEGDLSLYGSSANKTVYLSAYYDSYFVANGATAKLGIGTTSPFSLLHVGTRPGAGTTNPSLGSIATISNDGLTGIDLAANVNANNVVGHINWINYLGVGNYNTARIDVYADGGSNSGSLRFWTASASSSPTIRLTISSTGAATFSNYVTIGNSSTTPAILTLYPSASAKGWQITANNYVGSALEFTPATANGGTTFTTPAMLITSGGSVGVGTTSVDAKLSIAGASNTPTSFGNLLVKNSSETGISFGASSTSYAWIQGNIYGLSYDLNLVLNAQGGNVGINTISPQTKLQVNASSGIVSSTVFTIFGSYTGFNGANDADTAYSMNFDGCAYKASTGSTQRTGAQIQMVKSGSWNEADVGTGTRAFLYFKTNNGTIDSPDLGIRMAINPAGRVGINNTNFYAEGLTIHQDGGDSRVLLQLNRPNSPGLQTAIKFSVANIMVGKITHEYVASNHNDMSFTLRSVGGGDIIPLWLCNSGNTLMGYTSDNSNGKLQVNGTIYASGDVVAYSDISVKSNIRPIENVLSRITESRGVLYDRIDNKEKNNIGFIAQELEKQFPELIQTNKDGTKGVKYQNAVAVLFEAVKELKKEINELKDK